MFVQYHAEYHTLPPPGQLGVAAAAAGHQPAQGAQQPAPPIDVVDRRRVQPES